MGQMKDRMLRAELYNGADAEMTADFARAQDLLYRFNGSAPAEQAERDAILAELLGSLGDGVHIRPPFHLEYGTRVSIGAGTFINFGCVMLDVVAVTIGASCQVATCVQFLTATHPVDPEPRRAGWESAEPISVGDNVWLGGGAILCPGVRIGDDTVVGAGAVVTRDLPSGVVAVGSPARILREIGERDRIEMPEL